MASYNLYVGADNVTGEIDLDRIASIVSKRHAGFTLLPASGYWQGQPEPSCVVVISGASTYDVIETIADLRVELKQDAIGYQEVAALQFA